MSWCYCLTHQRVKPDDGCANDQRMGTYVTEVDASTTLTRAAERNAEFVAQDDD